MAIEVDRNLCEANGRCVAAAPEVFELENDEELVIHEPPVGAELAERIKVAVASCPRYALRVTG
ncbi:ferredoxin [Kutzneria kofuensis]|uniref:Ferredoxin n=1 Tax=Kutzneria kofuensis TaxID=103725 RepID=A0A7W9KAQ2_9PSEU|nr:ferredoxin [Kutzneria kofuensis]MBB5889060.1 ferredoxin [Kutzneria kofuensis]